MKQSLYIFTIIFFVFTGCSTDTKTASNPSVIEKERHDILETSREISEISFEDYLKTLDQIPLPFSCNPLGQLPELSTNYDKRGFEKYKHAWTSQPLGILYSDDKTVTLIECSIGDVGLVPFLVSYNRQGSKIDSLAPYQKSGEDMEHITVEYLTVNSDKTILITDSVTTYKLAPDKTNIDKTSKKVTAGLTKYIVNPEGYFKETK